ncbi:MAG: ATP-binding protein [Chitinispirillaceae bacterium]|nr:ATP-binding protein [Chitinispirillaceae bacterium]
MKRIIDYQLNNWKNQSDRKPLLIRGACQVGKTHCIRELGKTFPSYVEINFELLPKAASIFKDDLLPNRIIRDLSILIERPIEPGRTLLFFDEIQHCPQAIASLRYFYEKHPSLHVIAAGSLLEFALERTGVPVGRLSTLYLYPMSFLEFLAAYQKKAMSAALLESSQKKPLPDSVHNQLLKYLGEYMAIGGMPEAVGKWIELQSLQECIEIHADLIETYRQDFIHYSTRHQQPFVETLFNEIPAMIGKKFKYSAVSGEHRKRELAPALDLLVKAGIIHTVRHSPGQGLPLGAGGDHDVFKTIFLDCALAQTILGIKTGDWIIDAPVFFANKGEIIESFIGQELLAVMPPHTRYQLHYWLREGRSRTAEVDYLVQQDNAIVPIEVKSGKTGTLRSMHLFLEEHPRSPYGIRFSLENYSIYDRIHSFPLYAVPLAVVENQAALQFLCQ